MIADLVELYPKFLAQEVTNILNVKYSTTFSTEAIRSKAKRLGVLSYYTSEMKWTNEMITDLRELYSKYTTQEVTDIINKKYHKNYSKHVIRTRAHMLGIKNSMWTDEMKEFIKNNWKNRLPVLTKMFNKKFNTSVSKNIISFKRAQMGLYVKDEIFETYYSSGYYVVSVPKSHKYYDKLFEYSISSNTNDNSYRIIVPRSTYNWITSDRQILKGYRLLHINGNPCDDSLDNLRPCTQGERNKIVAPFNKIGGLRNVPTELVDTILAVAQLDTLVKEKLNV